VTIIPSIQATSLQQPLQLQSTIMKTFAILFASLAASVLAQDSVQIDLAQIANAQSSSVQKRGIFSSELENGACKQITFIYARGSTESVQASLMIILLKLTRRSDLATWASSRAHRHAMLSNPSTARGTSLAKA
jgi:hypothetical protein